jgi:hypothetical protein
VIRRIVLVPTVCAVLGAAGCSSISDSISSPFESSSASSRSLEGRETKFRRDVRDYTATFVRSNGNLAVFAKGIADLAAQRGVTNWESDMGTYTAVGQGLKDAGADPGTVEAYVANIAGGDANKAAAIRKGYKD